MSSQCHWISSPDSTDHVCVRSVLISSLLLLGCHDKNGGGVDAMTPDVPSRACDGRAYDLCTDTTASSDCMTGLTCRFYMMANFTICSPACDATHPCPPDEAGGAVTCNTMGRCRSNAPNTCTK